MSWIRKWLHLDDPDRAERRRARGLRNATISSSMNRASPHLDGLLGKAVHAERPTERDEGRS